MNQCPTCGKQMDEGTRFCPHDGTPLTATAAGGSTLTQNMHRSGTQKTQLQLPVVVGNRYQLVELRGGGGMARVYRSIDQNLEREVAVKLINPDLRADPEFDARFQREARIASHLADPHIVVVHDFGIDPTLGPYLVMEFLRGQSLRERLSSDGVLPLKAALQLGGQVLLALIHAHEQGIVHRDIKPDNIFLLNQSGVRLHVRVLDFGIARIYRDDAPGRGEPLTEPGAVMGTPRYMSPEQLAGQPVDARSDLYSAALVIYESLTGQLPYVSSKKLTELCLEATPALQELLEHCLKPDPAQRPASAIEVYLRLQELGKASGILLLPPGAMERLLANRQSQAHPAGDPTLPYPAPGSRRRWLLLAGLVLVLLLPLLIWAAVVLLRKSDSGPPPDAPTRESLLELQIGDSRDQAIARVGEVPKNEFHGDPWKKAGEVKEREALGHVLRNADFGPNVNLANLDTLIWSNGTAVILDQGRVLAIVTHHPKARSARDVKIGESEDHIARAYHDRELNQKPLEGLGGIVKKDLTLYRCNDLGIGFEVTDGKVTAIALYPPTRTGE